MSSIAQTLKERRSKYMFWFLIFGIAAVYWFMTGMIFGITMTEQDQYEPQISEISKNENSRAYGDILLEDTQTTSHAAQNEAQAIDSNLLSDSFDIADDQIVAEQQSLSQQRALELAERHKISHLSQLQILKQYKVITSEQYDDIYNNFEFIQKFEFDIRQYHQNSTDVKSLVTQQVPATNEEEDEQCKYDASIMAYLEKRNATFPALETSLIPYPAPEVISRIKSLLLDPNPNPLPEGELAWSPPIYGYTAEQAAFIYMTNRTHEGCTNWPDNPLFFDENNQIVVNWPRIGSIGYYMKGTKPEEEKLGFFEYEPNFNLYFQPVKADDSEFAFARWDLQQNYATLRNIKSEQASQRADKIAQNLANQVGTKEFRPISIHLMIIDSVSRNHFYRNFPKTVEWINENIVEGQYSEDTVIYDFIMNNSHGNNSIPNLMPLLFGYNADHHKTRTKGFTWDNEQDQYRFLEIQKEALWGIAKDLGFVTAFGFDTTWDYVSKVTSRKIDADHLLSNFWHGAKKAWQYDEWSFKPHWIGKKYSHWYMLDYVRQFHNNYKGNNRFAYMHNSAGHEDSGSVIQTVDEDLIEFIKFMAQYMLDNPQEDVVIMLSSDHGKQPRYMQYSHEGQMENKLPFHLMFANKSLISRLHAHENLLYNTKRLIGRYDWYMTMRHLALAPYGFLPTNSKYYDQLRTFTDSNNTISLIAEKIPNNRTCEDMDIASHICSWKEWLPLNISEPLEIRPLVDLVLLAETVINRDIVNHEVCQEITFKEIVQAEQEIIEHAPRGIRNFKAVASIEQNPQARFAIYGLMASWSDMGTWNVEIPGEESKGDMRRWNSEDQPITETRWWWKDEDNNYEEKKNMHIKLIQTSRLDRYAGICEEIARVTGEKASTCICKQPQSGQNITATQVEIFEKLYEHRTLQIGKQGQTCNEVWDLTNRKCIPWIFSAVRNVELLETLLNKKLGEDPDKIYDLNLEGCEIQGQLRPICPCE